MSQPSRLYNPQLLACAVGLADFPLDSSFSHLSSARSLSCGSSLEMGLDCDPSGHILRIGIRAQACAVGQAAAAIFARHACGKDIEDIAHFAASLRDWLVSDSAEPPAWPEIALLDPARSYPARHGAVMLAWDAALRGLSNLDIDG